MKAGTDRRKRRESESRERGARGMKGRRGKRDVGKDSERRYGGRMGGRNVGGRATHLRATERDQRGIEGLLDHYYIIFLYYHLVCNGP